MNTQSNTQSNNKSIALIGDSVLDDFYWLEDKTEDVRQQLSDLMPNATIHNFAVDESKIKDVLDGFQPFDHYQKARYLTFNGNYPYPTSKDGKVYPLELLKDHKPDYVVLSAGGNDGRVHLDKLMWSAQSLIEAVLNDKLVENFDLLLQEILKTNKKVILILVYKPHETIFESFRKSVGWGLQYLPIENVVDFAGRLEEVYDFFRKVFIDNAIKYNVPIIDLSKTFNPTDRSHYGSTPIEPSNKSGKTIARLIKHVVNKHDFNSSSYMYYMPDCGEKIKKRAC